MNPRVLHLTPSLSAGGAERQLSLLAPAIAQTGVDIAVAYGRGGPNLANLQRSSVTLFELPPRENHDPRLLLDLLRVARDFKPNAIQTWNLQMDVVGGLTAMAMGVPHIISERSTGLLYQSGWKVSLRRLIGGRAKAIIANSEGGRDYWRSCGVSTPLYLVRNGITPPGSATPQSGTSLADFPFVLVVGRLSSEKNPLAAMAAIAQAMRELPTLRALFLGEGVLEAELKIRIAAAGLENRLILGGVSDAVSWWMSRAHALVSASRLEGHPNVVIEAAAAGCPLVLSDIAAHREVVGSDAALFAGVDDVQSLASSIVATVTDREAAHRRAQRAREAVAELSFEGAARAYARVYNEVLL